MDESLNENMNTDARPFTTLFVLANFQPAVALKCSKIYILKGMETEEEHTTTKSTPERQMTGRDNIWANIQMFVFFFFHFHILTS